MLAGPFGVGGGPLHVVRDARSVEEPPADDFRHLGVGGHADRLTQAVEELLVGAVVPLVLGVHLHLLGPAWRTGWAVPGWHARSPRRAVLRLRGYGRR